MLSWKSEWGWQSQAHRRDFSNSPEGSTLGLNLLIFQNPEVRRMELKKNTAVSALTSALGSFGDSNSDISKLAYFS